MKGLMEKAQNRNFEGGHPKAWFWWKINLLSFLSCKCGC